MPNIEIIDAYKPILPENRTLKLIDYNESGKSNFIVDKNEIERILLVYLEQFYTKEKFKIDYSRGKWYHHKKYEKFLDSSLNQNQKIFKKYLDSDKFKIDTIFTCLNNQACDTLREESNKNLTEPSTLVLYEFNDKNKRSQKIIEQIKSLTTIIHEYNNKLTVLGLQYLNIPDPSSTNFQFIKSGTIRPEKIQKRAFFLNVTTWNQIIESISFDNPDFDSEELDLNLEKPEIDENTEEIINKLDFSLSIFGLEPEKEDKLLFQELEKQNSYFYYLQSKKEEYLGDNFWNDLSKDEKIPKLLFRVLREKMSIIPSIEFITTIKTRYTEILSHLQSINELLSVPNLQQLDVRKIKEILEYHDIDFTGKHGLTYQDKDLHDLIVVLEEILSGLIVEFLDIGERINNFLQLPNESNRQVNTYYSNKFNRYCIPIYDILERYSDYNDKSKTHRIEYMSIFPELEQPIIELVKNLFSILYTDLYPKLNESLYKSLPIIKIKSKRGKLLILERYYLYLKLYRDLFSNLPFYKTFDPKLEVIYQKEAKLFHIEHILSKPRYNLSNQINIRKLITAFHFFLCQNSISVKINPFPDLLSMKDSISLISP